MKNVAGSVLRTFAGGALAFMPHAGNATAVTLHSTLLPPAVPRVFERAPAADIVQTGHPRRWREFLLPTSTHNLNSIIAGSAPDSIWVPDFGDSALIHVGYDGSTKVLPLFLPSQGGTQKFFPFGGVLGQDGRLYLSGAVQSSSGPVGAIATVNTAGAVERISTPPSGDRPGYSQFVLGPDGNVWFVESSHVANIATTGVITEHAFPSGFSGSSTGITVGEDGQIWFSESGGSSSNPAIVATIDPSTGHIHEFAPINCGPINTMLGAPGGDVYAGCWGYNNQVFIKVSPSGHMSMKLLQANAAICGNMALDPNLRRIWFTRCDRFALGAYDLRSGAFSIVSPPRQLQLYGNKTSTVGPDGNIWIVSAPYSGHDAVEVYILNVLTVRPAVVKLGVGQARAIQVHYTGAGPVSAASRNRSVARVTRAGTTSFTIRGIGPGTASVVVQDTLHNSFSVLVTVS